MTHCLMTLPWRYWSPVTRSSCWRWVAVLMYLLQVSASPSSHARSNMNLWTWFQVNEKSKLTRLLFNIHSRTYCAWVYSLKYKLIHTLNSHFNIVFLLSKCFYKLFHAVCKIPKKYMYLNLSTSSAILYNIISLLDWTLLFEWK